MPKVNAVKTEAAKKVAVKATVAKSTVSAAAKPKTAAGKKVAKPRVAGKPVAAKSKAPAAKAVTKSAVKMPQAASKSVIAQKEKIKKPKLVRDSFTMPEVEYQVLSDVKKAFLKSGVSVKKSELLRAGVALIKNMELVKLNAVIAALAPIKAGRPKNDK